MRYQIVFRDHAREAYSCATIEAADDRAAIDEAYKLYRSGIGNGYEIWCFGRLIHTEPATP